MFLGCASSAIPPKLATPATPCEQPRQGAASSAIPEPPKVATRTTPIRENAEYMNSSPVLDGPAPWRCTPAVYMNSSPVLDGPAPWLFTPTPVVLTFFQPSTDTAKARLEEACRRLGLEIPTYHKMQPGVRRRLPAKRLVSAEEDTYIPILERRREGISHPEHNTSNKPTEAIEVTEDAHILARCLHQQLPRNRVQAPTKIARSENEFARRYGRRLATYARAWNATQWEADVMRLSPTHVHWLLHWWLSERLAEQAPFGWVGFTMTACEMEVAVHAACDDWLRRYCS